MAPEMEALNVTHIPLMYKIPQAWQADEAHGLRFGISQGYALTEVTHASG